MSSLPLEFVTLFESYKKGKPSLSSFDYIVFLIHWCMVKSGTDLVTDEGLSLHNLQEVIQENGTRHLVLCYQLHPVSIWRLTVIGNTKDNQFTLIGVGVPHPCQYEMSPEERQRRTKFAKIFIESETYVKNLNGKSAEEVYYAENIDELNSLLGKNGTLFCEDSDSELEVYEPME